MQGTLSQYSGRGSDRSIRVRSAAMIRQNEPEETDSMNFVLQEDKSFCPSPCRSLRMFIFVITACCVVGVFVLSALWIGTFLGSAITLSAQVRDATWDSTFSSLEFRLTSIELVVENLSLDAGVFNGTASEFIEILVEHAEEHYKVLHQEIMVLGQLDGIDMGAGVTNGTDDITVYTVASQGVSIPPQLASQWKPFTLSPAMYDVINSCDGNCWSNQMLVADYQDFSASCTDPAKCKLFTMFTAKIYNPQKAVRGHISILLLSDSLQGFLNSFYSKYALATIIIDSRSMKMIGAPSTFALLGKDSGSITTYTTLTHPDSYINKMGNAVKQRYAEAGKNLSETLTFTYYHQGITQYVKASTITTQNGLTLFTVNINSSQAYLTLSTILIVIAAICSLAFIVLIVVFGLIVIYSIVRPLQKMLVQMHLVESMKLEDILNAQSYTFFKEFASIQQEFYKMVLKLKEYKAYLPEHLLGKDEEEEEQPVKSSQVVPLLPDVPHRLSVAASRGTGLVRGNFMSSFGLTGKDSGAPPPPPPEASSSPMSRKSTESSLSYRGKFSIGVELKTATFLVVTIKNFWILMSSVPKEEVIVKHSKLLEEILKIVKKTKGDLTHFDETQFIITYNGSIRSTNHSKQACEAALLLKEAIRKLNEMFSQEIHPEKLKVSMGISTADCYMGNLGTMAKRQHRTFGTAEALAKLMEKLNSQWDTLILCNEECFTNVYQNYLLREIDRVSAPRVIRNSAQMPIRVFELVDRLMFTEDEWMYEMQAQELCNRILIFNAGFTAYMQGEWSAAKEKFRAFLEAFRAGGTYVASIQSQAPNTKGTESGLFSRSPSPGSSGDSSGRLSRTNSHSTQILVNNYANDQVAQKLALFCEKMSMLTENPQESVPSLHMFKHTFVEGHFEPNIPLN